MKTNFFVGTEYRREQKEKELPKFTASTSSRRWQKSERSNIKDIPPSCFKNPYNACSPRSHLSCCLGTGRRLPCVVYCWSPRGLKDPICLAQGSNPLCEALRGESTTQPRQVGSLHPLYSQRPVSCRASARFSSSVLRIDSLSAKPAKF